MYQMFAAKYITFEQLSVSTSPKPMKKGLATQSRVQIRANDRKI